MQRYIGTKIILAQSMTRGEYNEYRGWPLPPDEAASEAGYLVEYTDGGAPNHAQHAGYISWSPAFSFELAYRRSDGLPFGLAVEAMKAGQRVARAGWNGKGMFVYLVQGSTFAVNRAPLLGIYPAGTEITYRPHMDLRTADGSISTWAPSGSDALAEDWYILKEEGHE
ncbi:DUF2829 domain-containing protein [Chromobacterium vaccinii]|uniref:DUF2829 domain-containing protein n=1 Tax=Chromobacterium vaccinii TaxID=1108595 RepID=UPI0031DE3FC2